MTRSLVFLFMFFTTVLLFGACGDSEENHATLISLSENDNGRTVDLQVGDKLDVVLKENPSTGFIWETESLDETIVKQIGEPEFKADTGAIGSGGSKTFHFEVVASGQTYLKLILHRPWETDVPPSMTFEVTIIVK
jgi:predicted secreted protein